MHAATASGLFFFFLDKGKWFAFNYAVSHQNYFSTAQKMPPVQKEGMCQASLTNRERVSSRAFKQQLRDFFEIK